MFGYFTSAALEVQAGLDGGALSAPWIEQCDDALQIRVGAEEYRSAILRGDVREGQTAHLDLLDGLSIVPRGGRHGNGYGFASRRIAADDWYFDCHFYGDPVMPGSLGVEAMMQVLEVFARRSGATSHLKDPVFEAPVDIETTWKYRGQVLRNDPVVSVEIHVTEIRSTADDVIVIADGSLWNGGMRIYAVDNLATRARMGGSR